MGNWGISDRYFAWWYVNDVYNYIYHQEMITLQTAYAYVGSLIKPPLAHPTVDYVLQLDNLCQHYERMNQ